MLADPFAIVGVHNHVALVTEVKPVGVTNYFFTAVRAKVLHTPTMS